ncbi:hypothetical protein JHK86_004459 [Glycine max]|nr:hypothetical protein JHK86_004459 [Glycine max]
MDMALLESKVLSEACESPTLTRSTVLGRVITTLYSLRISAEHRSWETHCSFYNGSPNPKDQLGLTVGRIIGSPFGGGPVDLYLLKSYRDHCVGHIWNHQERQEVKHVSHDAQYLDNLGACHKYAWGVAALTYLYDHLSYASKYNSKSCGGYVTLLMDYVLEDLEATRYNPLRGTERAFPVRKRLDDLHMDVVV